MEKPTQKAHRLGNFIATLVNADVPILSTLLGGILFLCSPFVLYHRHRQTKRELAVIWGAVDRLGLTSADLKRLSRTSDFGAIDWQLTKPGRNQNVAIPLEVLQPVREQLEAMLHQV